MTMDWPAAFKAVRLTVEIVVVLWLLRYLVRMVVDSMRFW